MDDRCANCPAETGAFCEREEGDFKIAIVIDFPTTLEAHRGAFMEGDTGQLIRAVMRANGIEDHEYYVTSALNCRPTGYKRETVLRTYMEACRQRLIHELIDVGVKKVLCMGPVGYSALMSSPKIVRTVKHRGRWKQAYGMNILLTYNPINVMVDPMFFRDFSYDATKFLTADCREPYPRVDVWMPKTSYELVDAFDMLSEYPHVSADFETTGFSPQDDRPLALGYCAIEEDPTIGHAVVIVQRLLDMPKTWKLIGKQLSSDQPTVWHNAKFDLKFARVNLEMFDVKYDPWNIHDTMMLSYLVDERSGKYAVHGLENLARFRYDAPDYGVDMGKWLRAVRKITDVKELHAEWKRMCTYCGIDCYYTARLFPDLLAELEDESPKLTDVYYDVLVPAVTALADVELHGFRIDTLEMEELREELVEDRDAAQKRLRKVTGNPDFNPSSPKQVHQLLYRDLKLPPIKSARKGKAVEGPTSAPILRLQKEAHPEHADILDDIIEYRTMVKAIGTYVDGMLEKVDSDERIRTDLLLHGTETGRLSSRGPNMQNVQEVSKHDIDVRGCFKPTSDAWILFEGDYSQLEPRVAAHLSGDPDWTDAFRRGLDLHQTAATRLFGVSADETTVLQRWLAKTAVLGTMYGRGGESVAYGPEMNYVVNELGGERWTAQQTTGFFKALFDQYPTYKQWVDRQHQIAYREHFIETPFGRRRRFPFIPRNDRGLVARQSVNTPIQSTASDITLSALVRIHERFQELNEDYGKTVAHVILSIHDSILGECRKSVRKTVAAIVREEMEDYVPLKSKVPFKAEIHWGSSWTELK
jgi:DNA polymerase-1